MYDVHDLDSFFYNFKFKDVKNDKWKQSKL